MENETPNWMPKHLDSPYQISNFEIEEVIVVILPMCLFLIFKEHYWLFVSMIGYFLIKKMKEKFPKGVLFNLLYIWGILDLEGYPPGQAKEFLE